MASKKSLEKIHDYLDLVFRLLFLILLIVFILILIFETFVYPDQFSIITVTTALIFLFAWSGGFFKKVKTIKMGPFEAVFEKEKIKKEITKKRIEEIILSQIKDSYQNLPEDFQLEPIGGIIDASNLNQNDILRLTKYKKILEELNNV